ncbi:MAG: 3D domain-containing protein [Anaerostipes sp.]|uniref:3D domain-containing protein n=1 Tax=Anaerostipes sp. TaxID=1872530 RepID=UPI003992A420
MRKSIAGLTLLIPLLLSSGSHSIHAKENQKQNNLKYMEPIVKHVSYSEFHLNTQKLIQEKLNKKKQNKKSRKDLKKKKKDSKIAMGEFLLTAYCPCEQCSEGYGKRIAWQRAGHKYAYSGHTIAVDPNIIPYGTKVKIEGFGDTVYTAEDCGGGVNGDHIDIYMDNHYQTEEFGKKYRKVYIVK